MGSSESVQSVTPWFPISAEPAREGWYEMRLGGKVSRIYYDRHGWRSALFQLPIARPHLEWRGQMKKPPEGGSQDDS